MSIKYFFDEIKMGSNANILTIYGWALSSSGKKVLLKFNEIFDYRYTTNSREDVYEKYKDQCLDSNVGFCIEIFGSGLSDVLTGTFSDGESELKFNINIKKIASVQLRKKTITKDNLKNMCSMQSDGWRYTIEHIWMDQAKESFVFYGWALYGMDKVEISSFDEREEVIRCSRQDVKDYYEGENVSAMSGFEIYVPQPKAFQKIVLNFVYNEQILELAFSEETLKKFKERGVEKKVRGNRLNFFQKLEMWKKEREYVYKYGLEGAA